MMGGMFFVLSMSLFMFGMIVIFISRQPFMINVYLIVCIIFYGFYLIYDTQLIVGGKRRELTVDDYVIGALILYLDIIIIFLKLLQLLYYIFIILILLLLVVQFIFGIQVESDLLIFYKIKSKYIISERKVEILNLILIYVQVIRNFISLS